MRIPPELQKRIDDLQAELRKAQEVAEYFQSLPEESRPTPPRPKHVRRTLRHANEAGLKTIVDFARVVLGDAGSEGMHFRDIAVEAVKKGYRGKAGSTPEAIADSFRVTLRRHGDVFTRTSEGHFRLG